MVRLSYMENPLEPILEPGTLPGTGNRNRGFSPNFEAESLKFLKAYTDRMVNK